MTDHKGKDQTAGGSTLRRAWQDVRRAFSEFLTIPTLAIAGFLALSAGMYQLDHLRIELGWPALIPVDHDSIRTSLGTIATSIITVTSITFSLLLIAVQQGATSLTAQVYDQFLRRRANQAYFGFFTGLALYSLVILSMVHPGYTPVYGAILAFLLTVVALYLLILLIYSTIDQMRPVRIVQSIRDHTLAARDYQEDLLGKTRRNSIATADSRTSVRAEGSGYVASIDVPALDREANRCGASEVRLLHSIGDYVSLGQPLAEIAGPAGTTTIDPKRIQGAIALEQQRDLGSDPAFGIEQLATIGWTSTSTSKSNPHPGRLACWNLRDLIACWFPPPPEQPDTHEDPNSHVVYSDNVPMSLLHALESLTVVTSESMQHQTLAAVYHALALAVRRMPSQLQSEIETIVLRSLSSLGDHVLTQALDSAIEELTESLKQAGMRTQELSDARNKLARSIGKLASRANRSTPDKLS